MSPFRRGDASELIERIHASPGRCALAVAGGGSRAIARLLSVPGASRTVLEAVAPHSAGAMADYLGGPPDSACSERTARRMAMAAWRRARSFDADLDGDARGALVGVGCTAALVTDRVRRGARRFWIALQTATRTAVYGLELGERSRTRSEEEDLAADRLIALLSDAFGLDRFAYSDGVLDAAEGDSATWRESYASEQLAAVFLGIAPSCLIANGAELPRGPRVVFPGSFDPMHDGHREMIALAEQVAGVPVVCELSLLNVDKPPLDLLDVEARLAGMRGAAVLATAAPTFVDKARVAPGAMFVVGVDTIARIGEPRYYDHDPDKRDRAIAEIAAAGCRFLVFSRVMDGRVESLESIGLHAELRALCAGVPPERFRNDVSSTDIRGQNRDGQRG